MGLSEKLMAQASKPSGMLGRLVGYVMNLGHTHLYRWGLDHISLAGSSAALDIGCGGGRAIKLLAAGMPEGKVYGIDHSLEMVSLAQRVNRSLIERDRVEINHGSVSSLPYRDSLFDVITAFETIQFWPNLTEDLREVKRVLKPSGKLLVVNRYPDLEEQETNWAEVLQIHSSEDYRERLGDAGFAGVLIDDSSRPDWILVLGGKP